MPFFKLQLLSYPFFMNRNNWCLDVIVFAGIINHFVGRNDLFWWRQGQPRLTLKQWKKVYVLQNINFISEQFVLLFFSIFNKIMSWNWNEKKILFFFFYFRSLTFKTWKMTFFRFIVLYTFIYVLWRNGKETTSKRIALITRTL